MPSSLLIKLHVDGSAFSETNESLPLLAVIFFRACYSTCIYFSLCVYCSSPFAFGLQPWTINQLPWLLGRRLLPLHRGIRLLTLLLRRFLPSTTKNVQRTLGPRNPKRRRKRSQRRLLAHCEQRGYSAVQQCIFGRASGIARSSSS